MSKDESRAIDWLRQAEDDLRWAVDSLKSGHYAQTCFICQQIGEKALKSLAFYRGASVVRGHSILKIAVKLKVNGKVERAARKLDLYYVSARYPDAFPAGRPNDFFSVEEAHEAVQLARDIIDLVSAEVK